MISEIYKKKCKKCTMIYRNVKIIFFYISRVNIKYKYKYWLKLIEKSRN